MPDREKVTKALEKALAISEAVDSGYIWITVGEGRKALELLKEQEPRVLIWDEVKQAEVCWVEERDKEPYATLDAADWNQEYYGKEIRCWNAKPTKEQRDAVKWDD